MLSNCVGCIFSGSNGDIGHDCLCGRVSNNDGLSSDCLRLCHRADMGLCGVDDLS